MSRGAPLVAGDLVVFTLDGLASVETILPFKDFETGSIHHYAFVDGTTLRPGATAGYVLPDEPPTFDLAMEAILGKLATLGRARRAKNAFSGPKPNGVTAPSGLLNSPAKFNGLTNNTVNRLISPDQHVLLRELFKGKAAQGITRETLEAAAELSHQALRKSVTSAPQKIVHQQRLQQIAEALGRL